MDVNGITCAFCDDPYPGLCEIIDCNKVSSNELCSSTPEREVARGILVTSNQPGFLCCKETTWDLSKAIVRDDIVEIQDETTFAYFTDLELDSSGHSGCETNPIFGGFNFPSSVSNFGRDVCTKCPPGKLFNQKTKKCAEICEGFPVYTIDEHGSLIREDTKDSTGDDCYYYDTIHNDTI